MFDFDSTHHTWTHEEYANGDDGGYMAYLAQVEAYEAFQQKTTREDESQVA